MLFSLAAAFAGTPVSNADELSARLEALPDDTYIGGMGPAMQAIAQHARSLARDEVGRPLSACGPRNALAGTLVMERENPEPSVAAPPDVAVVRMLAGHLDSPRAIVRDTAAYALSEIGPDARGALAGRRFDSNWSPWLSHAGEKLRCESLSLGSAPKVIPPLVMKRWLGEQGTDVGAGDALAMILAERALRDPELYWPDGLFAEWLDRVDEGDVVPANTMLALGEVVADGRRSPDMRSDLAYLLGEWRSQATPAVPGLHKAMMGEDEKLAWVAAEAMVRIGGEAGIDGAAWLFDHDGALDHNSTRDLCALGPASAQRLAPFYITALSSPNWQQAEFAASLLGCVTAKDAVPQLLVALDRPVWRIQAEAARSLRKLAGERTDVRERLEDLMQNHWSGVVREAAGPPKPEEEVDLLAFKCFHRCAVDHGNHSCAGSDIRDGMYAIDGGKPFKVRWNRAKRHPLPKGFPLELRQDSREDYGTNTFLRVPGGWLYGTDRWHYDGELTFVTDQGVRQPLPGFANEPAFLLELPGFGRIALGRWLFLADDAGVLSVLTAGPDQQWNAEPRIALPTIPHAWAAGPNGELLVADTQNSVAVWPNGRIANLECP